MKKGDEKELGTQNQEKKKNHCVPKLPWRKNKGIMLKGRKIIINLQHNYN